MMETNKKCRWCKHLSRKGDKFYCDARNKIYAYKSIINMSPDSCIGLYEQSELDAISGRLASERVDNEVRCFRCGAYIGNNKSDRIYCEKCSKVANEEDRQKIRKNMNNAVAESLVLAMLYTINKDYSRILSEIKRISRCDKMNDDDQNKILALLYKKRKMENYLFSDDFEKLNFSGINASNMIRLMQEKAGYSEEEYGA